MAKQPTYDVQVTKVPEPNPNATTGDPVERTELSVQWKGYPSERQIAVFEREYPPQHYHAFHYIEGVGKVHESAT